MTGLGGARHGTRILDTAADMGIVDIGIKRSVEA